MATTAPTHEATADSKQTIEPAAHKRTVGQVTTAAGSGSAIGGALATLIVAVFGLDWDAATVAALTTVLSSGLAFLGGYLVPSRKGELQAQVADAMTLTQAEKEELVESATRRAASLAVPDIPALVNQILDDRDQRDVLSSEPDAEEAQPDTSSDGGAGLSKYSL